MPFDSTEKFCDLILIQRLDLLFLNTGKYAGIGRVYADIPVGYSLLQHVVSKDGNIFASNVLVRINALVRG